MQIEHLYYLKTVIECKSISLAAEKLYISQQSLSDIIRKLEKTLTVDLLRRSNRGVSLTPAGERALPQIYALLADYENLLQITSEQEDMVSELNMLNNKFINGNYFTDIISLFTSDLPQVCLHVEEDLDPEVILKAVIGNKVDMGITPCSLQFLQSNPLLKKHLNKSILAKEVLLDYLYIIVSCDNPLISRASASIEDLFEHPLILNNHSYLQQAMAEAFPDRPLNIFLNTSNPYTQLQAIQDNLGIGITLGLTSFRDDLHEFTNVRIIPIMDAALQIMVFISMNQANNYALNHFIKIFQGVLEERTASLQLPFAAIKQDS